MIILNEKKINIFLEESLKKVEKMKIEQLESLIEEYEASLNYEYMECPICACNKLISYGSYKRNIGFGITFKRIRIKRVQCKNCNRTHAVIPSFIKPYFQYESSFIDYVMLLIKAKKIKKTKIENMLKLSRYLIRKWEKRFNEHEIRLKVTFTEKDISNVFKRMLSDKFMMDYYRENRLYYFQKVPT